VHAAHAALLPGQALIAVTAVGLNFRDVLNVLDMYPGDPGAPGSDCSGVVVSLPPATHSGMLTHHASRIFCNIAEMPCQGAC